MNAIERALEKQRLQLEIATQRAALARHATGLRPLFDAADQVRAGARWVQRHPEVVAGGVAVIAAVRPGVRRFLWRWGQRAFLVWQFWRDALPADERATRTAPVARPPLARG